MQLVRELDVPEGWPGGDDNHLGLLVNETVQVGQSAAVGCGGWSMLCAVACIREYLCAVVAAAAALRCVHGRCARTLHACNTRDMLCCAVMLLVSAGGSFCPGVLFNKVR